MKANQKIRNALYENHLYMYQLSDIAGWSESTVFRKMRQELPRETQDEICRKIKDYADTKRDRNHGGAEE